MGFHFEQFPISLFEDAPLFDTDAQHSTARGIYDDAFLADIIASLSSLCTSYISLENYLLSFPFATRWL
jgi:hypothetical protein